MPQFNYPATELFSPGGFRRVVWSQEEFDCALAEGWLAEKPVEPSPELLVEGTAKPKRGGKFLAQLPTPDEAA